MPAEPPIPPRRRFRRLRRFVLFLVFCLASWLVWKWWVLRDADAAVAKANRLGWKPVIESPLADIRADWKSAFKAGTWMNRRRALDKTTLRDLELRPELLPRLKLTHFTSRFSEAWSDLKPLAGADTLKSVTIRNAPKLQSLAGIEGLPNLERLWISGPDMLKMIPSIRMIDEVRSASRLRGFGLSGANALQGIEALGSLKELETVELYFAPEALNLDTLANLPRLKFLGLDAKAALANAEALKRCKSLEVLVVNDWSFVSTPEFVEVKRLFSQFKIFHHLKDSAVWEPLKESILEK